jgi:hypothetical protein
VSAVVLNLTATGASRGGYLTAFASDATQPGASNLNFVTGSTVPNLVEVPVGASGSIAIYNGSSAGVQAVADVVGYYTSANAAPSPHGLYTPLTPARILDTRFEPAGPLAGGEARHLTVAGAGGVPMAGVTAALLNTTVTGATSFGYLTVFPSDANRPNASNLNFVAGQTVPNLVASALDSGGSVTIYNGSTRATQVISDVQGFFS